MDLGIGAIWLRAHTAPCLSRPGHKDGDCDSPKPNRAEYLEVIERRNTKGQSPLQAGVMIASRRSHAPDEYVAAAEELAVQTQAKVPHRAGFGGALCRRPTAPPRLSLRNESTETGRRFGRGRRRDRDRRAGKRLQPQREQGAALVSIQAQAQQAQEGAARLRVEQRQSPLQQEGRRKIRKWWFEFAFVNSLEASRALC